MSIYSNSGPLENSFPSDNFKKPTTPEVCLQEDNTDIQRSEELREVLPAERQMAANSILQHIVGEADIIKIFSKATAAAVHETGENTGQTPSGASFVGQEIDPATLKEIVGTPINVESDVNGQDWTARNGDVCPTATTASTTKPSKGNSAKKSQPSIKNVDRADHNNSKIRAEPTKVDQLKLIGGQFFLGLKPVNFEDCSRDVRDAHHQSVRHAARHKKREDEKQSIKFAALLVAAQKPPSGSSSSSRRDRYKTHCFSLNCSVMKVMTKSTQRPSFLISKGKWPRDSSRL